MNTSDLCPSHTFLKFSLFSLAKFGLLQKFAGFIVKFLFQSEFLKHFYFAFCNPVSSESLLQEWVFKTFSMQFGDGSDAFVSQKASGFLPA